MLLTTNLFLIFFVGCRCCCQPTTMLLCSQGTTGGRGRAMKRTVYICLIFSEQRIRHSHYQNLLKLCSTTSPSPPPACLASPGLASSLGAFALRKSSIAFVLLLLRAVARLRSCQLRLLISPFLARSNCAQLVFHLGRRCCCRFRKDAWRGPSEASEDRMAARSHADPHGMHRRRRTGTKFLRSTSAMATNLFLLLTADL